MTLKTGVDYACCVDIAKYFRTWNIKGKAWMYFSLARTVYGLLGTTIQGASHSSLEDAQMSMKLYQVVGVITFNE